MPSSYTASLPNDILIDSAVLYYSGGDGTFSVAGLAKDTVPAQFKTTRTARYKIAGVTYSKVATTGIAFTAAHVVTASKFGIVLVQINAAGTISTKVPVTPQAYNDAAAALAALPAADAANVALGYIALNNNAIDWTANTHALTDGVDLTTASLTDQNGGMTKFGATRGGITFKRNTEWRNVPYDGASGETAGLHRKTDGVPTLEGTILLFGPTSISKVLEPGSTAATTGTTPSATQTITPLPYRTMLLATQLHRYECLWKRGNGGTVKVIFPLGLAVMDTIGAADNNEGEIPIVVRAVNDPVDIVGVDEVRTPYFYEITGSDV